MTGISDFNPVLSRLSLAVLEDSGWYRVDYSAAEDLPWGHKRGCDFVRRGCGNMLDMEPYCGKDVGNRTLGCTLDRGSVGLCSLTTLDEDVLADFRYLPGESGGSLALSDYCPYFRGFERPLDRTGNCTNSMNQPDPSTSGGGEDVFGETYGPDSICLQHGRNWEKVITRDDGTRSTLSVRTYGGGCYETKCSADDGLTVYVRGAEFQCEFEGQELVVNVTVGQSTFRGSIICPSPVKSSCSTEIPTLIPIEIPIQRTPSGGTGPVTLPLLSILLVGQAGLIMK